MKARIYSPAKTVMQSGRGKSESWCIDFLEEGALYQDPLMGWVGSKSTRSQIKLTFPSVKAAAAYLERYSIDYIIDLPEQEKITAKKYADNFS
tara:strand:+ start:158 stop:436 length:279 start_codon:yes stop_codon:yes gene_type:complete